MPHSGETAQELLEKALPLPGTDGAAYVQRRGISLEVAQEAGLRYAENFNGRPAVIAPLTNAQHEVCSVHGRYLTTIGKENKMCTIGIGDAVVWAGTNNKQKPIIIVEGLFDALSLAECGWSAIAPIGRRISWLPEYCNDREVWLAFDNCKPAERDVLRYREELQGARIKRVYPPRHYKDWNTALVKGGKHLISRWREQQVQG